MSKAIICGTDAHDNSLVCRVGVDIGEPETLSFGNTRSGRKKLFDFLNAQKQKHGAERVVNLLQGREFLRCGAVERPNIA
ncbi:MAG: hypothetical protein ACI9OU_002434 [Candidatus Promineifilaceae bacterium]|jgi:hypothetical protein